MRSSVNTWQNPLACMLSWTYFEFSVKQCRLKCSMYIVNCVCLFCMTEDMWPMLWDCVHKAMTYVYETDVNVHWTSSGIFEFQKCVCKSVSNSSLYLHTNCDFYRQPIEEALIGKICIWRVTLYYSLPRYLTTTTIWIWSALHSPTANGSNISSRSTAVAGIYWPPSIAPLNNPKNSNLVLLLRIFIQTF